MNKVEKLRLIMLMFTDVILFYYLQTVTTALSLLVLRQSNQPVANWVSDHAQLISVIRVPVRKVV